MDAQDNGPLPPNAGAGPVDVQPGAAQSRGYEEVQNLAPDWSLADPAVQAAS